MYIFAWWLCYHWSPLTNSIIFLLLPQMRSLMVCRGFRPLVISMAMVFQYLILLLNASAASELTLDAEYSHKQQIFRCQETIVIMMRATHTYIVILQPFGLPSVTLPTITSILLSRPSFAGRTPYFTIVYGDIHTKSVYYFYYYNINRTKCLIAAWMK